VRLLARLPAPPAHGVVKLQVTGPLTLCRALEGEGRVLAALPQLRPQASPAAPSAPLHLGAAHDRVLP